MGSSHGESFRNKKVVGSSHGESFRNKKKWSFRKQWSLKNCSRASLFLSFFLHLRNSSSSKACHILTQLPPSFSFPLPFFLFLSGPYLISAFGNRIFKVGYSVVSNYFFRIWQCLCNIAKNCVFRPSFLSSVESLGWPVVRLGKTSVNPWGRYRKSNCFSSPSLSQPLIFYTFTSSSSPLVDTSDTLSVHYYSMQ